MKRRMPLLLSLLLCGVSALVCSCSTHKTIGGEPLSKRTSLKTDEVLSISKIVEAHVGREVFWDGPYRVGDAVRHAGIGATETMQRAFSDFARQRQGERFFICFDFVVMDGFPKGHARGYVPKSVMTVGPDGEVDWFDLKEPIQSAVPTRGNGT